MKRQLRNKTRRRFLFKIDIPVFLAFTLFAGLIFLYLIPGFEKVMMDRKRDMIHEMTSSAYSIIEYFHSLEVKGLIDAEEAKKQAADAISTIRYGDTRKDYFWITDTYPHMINHPYRPELNGTDLRNFRDSNGKQVFVEFVNAVSSGGESYVDYMWQWNDDSSRIVPKLSYVRLYEPWAWIIGTGIYVEDVQNEIDAIELGAMVISGIIGLVIIFLLTAIARQSHKLEQRRSEAVEDLHKSRELYRTLAEASSEGVLIWSGPGLQANKTLLSILGYSEEELQQKNLYDIVSTSAIPGDFDSGMLYEELSTSIYAESVLKIKSGDLIKAHSDFSRILLSGMKAVMVVIRPIQGVPSISDFTPSSSIINISSSGFFRTTYGKTNRFLFATRSTIEMLGFMSLDELLSYNIESLFADPVQQKVIRHTLSAKQNIIRLEALMKRKRGSDFWALINIVIIENNPQDIWCEGSIEPLNVSVSRHSAPLVDLHRYSSSFIMGMPVSSVMRPPLECPANYSASLAISMMKENNSDFVIVINKSGEPMGIADIGLIGFRLSEGGSRETEIFRWMSSPPDFISIDETINKAFENIQASQRKCLLVSTEEGIISGMLTYRELSKSFFTAPELLESEIATANSSDRLKNIFSRSHELAVSMVLGNAEPYSVSLFLSSVADLICKRVLTICMEKEGEAPCRFAFIQTGSAGRNEQSFLTDQDNAFIFENRTDNELQIAYTYFLSLGKNVNKMLAEIGYKLCRGDNMAGNPLWCQPIDKWKKYFSDWINIPGPEELLEVSIFFDFRFCFGDKNLSDELRQYINKGLKTNDIFFHHMSSALIPFNPSISSLSEKDTDIKRLLMPLTGIIRLYTLRDGGSSHSTIERIIELRSGTSLNSSLLIESISAWNDLTSIRLRHQAACINDGTEPDNRVDFQFLNKSLYAYARQAITTINNLMLKTSNDFHSGTL